MESTVFANHGATVSTADQQQFNATVKCPKSEWSSFTEEQKQQTYRQWEEAIAEMPMSEKAAYLEAQEKAPEVVQEETPPLKFLRFCNFDTWKATKRITTYWRERKELFQDRAFLPLTLNTFQQGGSALNEGDILTLQAGYPAMLPRVQTCDNNNNNQVVLTDRSRWLLATTTRENRMRAVWYIVHKLSIDERAQTEEGAVLVFLMTIRPRLQDVDHILTYKMWSMVDHVFPVRFKFNSCCFLPRTMRGMVATAKGQYVSKSAFIEDAIFTTYGVRVTGLSRVNIHWETQEGDIYKMMKDHGLSDDGIPNFVSGGGGTWSYVNARKWCDEQGWLERQSAHQKISHGNKEKGKSATVSSKRSIEEHLPANAMDDTIVDQKRRRREKNVLHSRTKRERKRQELKAMTQERDRLLKQNASLLAEQHMLQDVLEKTQKILGKEQTECWREEFGL